MATLTPNFPNGYYTVTLSFTSATAWSVSGTNNWSDSGSWSSNVPIYNNSPPAGCTAMFGANGSGTVVLPGSGATTYVNTLVFANSSNSYTLTAGSGGSTLEFLPSATKAGGGAIPEGAAYVEVVSGQPYDCRQCPIGLRARCLDARSGGEHDLQRGLERQRAASCSAARAR